MGKRVKIHPRIHCIRQAVERRELIVRQYRKLDFRVSDDWQWSRAGDVSGWGITWGVFR